MTTNANHRETEAMKTYAEMNEQERKAMASQILSLFGTPEFRKTAARDYGASIAAEIFSIIRNLRETGNITDTDVNFIINQTKAATKRTNR